MKKTHKPLSIKGFKLGSKVISQQSPCYIIAEIGSNHDRQYKQAIRLIDAAKAAGADAVKFQTFKAQTLYSRYTPQFKNQHAKPYDIIKKIEMPWEWHADLKRYCDKIKIDFCSTPFDLEAVEVLEQLDVPFYKVASSEIDDVFLLSQIAKTRKPIIVSTGKASLKEVERTVNFLKQKSSGPIALLHCVSQYPTQYQDVHLRSMVTLQETFRTVVGLSDHTLDNVASLGAVVLGARIIEKHITVSRKLKGPDHHYALEPKDLESLVRDIRHIEECMGSALKQVRSSEIEDKQLATRSLHAKEDIAKGTVITKQMLAIKRPSLGISPWQMHHVLGKKAVKDIKADQWITKEFIR